MFVAENKRSRTLLVRLARGASLIASIEQAARDHAVTTALVRAHGVLARATLDARTPMRSETRPRAVEGPLELVSLTGEVATHEGRLHFEGSVVLALHADHGLVTLGGHLVAAETEGVTVVIECLDDLGLRREAERPSGLLGFRDEGASARAARAPVAEDVRAPRGREIRPGTAGSGPAPAPSVPSAWAAAVRASSERDVAPAVELPSVVDPIDDRGGAEGDDPTPEAGDWVDHRQFGLCRVDRATPDGELLIRLENGRRKEIRLDYLDVLPPRKDGARRIFPLRPKKP